jgi:hypothetical protein
MKRAILVSPCLFSLCLVAFVGCGSARPTLKGFATIDGQPFVGTLYVLNPTTQESALGPVNGKDGSFTVENAPLGKVKIYVEPQRLPGGNQGANAPGRPSGAGTQKLLPPKDSPEEAYPRQLQYLAKNPALREALERSEELDPKFKNAKDSPVETEIKPGTNVFDVKLTKAP